MALLTIGGLMLGLVADFVAGGVDLALPNVFLAVLMSPLLAVVGGRAVAVAPGLFLVGGLLFWPVWFLLAWRWVKAGPNMILAALILAWATQGFFQLLHRFSLVMSA